MNYDSGRKLHSWTGANSVSLCSECGSRECAFGKMEPPRSSIHRHHLERGQSLECHDTGCLRFWIVELGNAAISTFFRDGRRQILSVEYVGAVVCGSMAMEESEQRLEALTDCDICEVDLTPWARELRRDPDFMTTTFQLMHDRLEKSTTHLAMLGRLDSQERVLFFLAEMAARHSDKGSIVTLPMSREDIADYLGLNSDSVSRILSRIRKSGLVRFLSPTEFTVPDIAAVERRLPVAVPKPHAAQTAHGVGGHMP
ncbi:MAG: Crp/Fnr family transcriptional regulator [Dinoroseobacter sp.]|nr:Crp/Fnr family transcriptional regulator [Dinoroseobacter sp.]